MACILEGLHVSSPESPLLTVKMSNPQQAIGLIVRKMNLQVQHRATSSQKHTILSQMVIKETSLALTLTCDSQQNISATIRCIRGSTYQRHIDGRMRVEAVKQVMKYSLNSGLEAPIGALLEVQGQHIMRVQIRTPALTQLEGKKLTELCHVAFMESIKNLLLFSGKHKLYPSDKSGPEAKMQQELRTAQSVSHTILSLEHYEWKSTQEYTQRVREEQSQIAQVIGHFETDNDPSRALFTLPDSQGTRDKTDLQRKISSRRETVANSYDEEYEEAMGRKLEDYQFNMAEIQVQNVLPQPIAQGGTSQIFIAKVMMALVNSADFSRYEGRKKRQATIAVKKLKPAFKQTMGDHLRHEREVVRRLKNTSCIFIPKFYGSAHPCDLSDGVMMEVAMGEELDSFLRNRAITVSLHTKLTLLNFVILGLRKLRDYQIVHLDLKPTNLIITRFLIPKIIDFGQAYHPELCPKDHKPGYTFPYCAPQVYQLIKNISLFSFGYSEKQDVFAFGCLMFETIFGHKMFACSPEKYAQLYSMGDVRRAALYCAEGIELAQGCVFGRVLFVLSLKCMDPDPNKRPQLDWLGIIISKIIDCLMIS